MSLRARRVEIPREDPDRVVVDEDEESSMPSSDGNRRELLRVRGIGDVVSLERVPVGNREPVSRRRERDAAPDAALEAGFVGPLPKRGPRRRGPSFSLFRRIRFSPPPKPRARRSPEKAASPDRIRTERPPAASKRNIPAPRPARIGPPTATHVPRGAVRTPSIRARSFARRRRGPRTRDLRESPRRRRSAPRASPRAPRASAARPCARRPPARSSRRGESR